MNTAVTTEAQEDPVKLMEFNFRFKKDKLGNQRPAVKLKAPVPTATGLVEILTSGDQKQFSLLQDACFDVIRDVLATMVAEKEDINQDNLDMSKLT